MTWKRYQEEAAELFRSIGCRADVEKPVQGVRSAHKIDVWVTRAIYGLDHSWVVECKYWNRRVKKENVVVLRGVVDDIGADRGILLSSSGFQSGAISMAESSNITLSSIDEMRESVRVEMERYTLSSLEVKAAKIAAELHSLFIHESSHDGDFYMSTVRPRAGVSGKVVREAAGKLYVLEAGFRDIRVGRKQMRIRFADDGNAVVVTDDLAKFLEAASSIVREAEDVLKEQNGQVQPDS